MHLRNELIARFLSLDCRPERYSNAWALVRSFTLLVWRFGFATELDCARPNHATQNLIWGFSVGRRVIDRSMLASGGGCSPKQGTPVTIAGGSSSIRSNLRQVG
jgi:hypothetical protein